MTDWFGIQLRLRRLGSPILHLAIKALPYEGWVSAEDTKPWWVPLATWRNRLDWLVSTGFATKSEGWYQMSDLARQWYNLGRSMLK